MSDDKQMMSPMEDSNDDESRSPIRPQPSEPYRGRIMPSMPTPSLPDKRDTNNLTATERIDSDEPEISRAVEAMERLKKKMNVVADEFANGEINRAQFDAIYARYQEQRQITERLIDRDPETGAWKSVMRPGHTNYLREQYEAAVQSYAIYHLKDQIQIVRTGHFQIPKEQMMPIVVKLHALLTEKGYPPAPAYRDLSDERWVYFLPGNYSLAVVIFSREPAQVQLEHVRDIHTDFERANQYMFSTGNLNREEMVFPHRALFEL